MDSLMTTILEGDEPRFLCCFIAAAVKAEQAGPYWDVLPTIPRWLVERKEWTLCDLLNGLDEYWHIGAHESTAMCEEYGIY